jgi:hypothetical protein
MVSLGAKANLKRLNPKSGHETRAAGCLSGSGLSNPSGCRHPLSSGWKKPLAARDFVKPVEKKRLLVIQWVARHWVQPIGRA